MEVGDILVHKKDGCFGEVQWSLFGFSIYFNNYNEEYGLVRGKTNGMPENGILEHWRFANNKEIDMFESGKFNIKE